jgi:carboxymethylenebutenolidase
MRQIILILVLGIISTLSGQDKSCCTVSKDTSFSKFSSDKVFKDIHQIPAAFTLKKAKGKMITFKTKDGNDANAYFIKSANESDKFIFVFHEWWGLNDYVKKESDELQTKLGDINILAIDLYDGNLALNVDDAKYMQAVDQITANNIINGAMILQVKVLRSEQLMVLGGGWSLRSSIMLVNTLACVMYYGIIDNTIRNLKI